MLYRRGPYAGGYVHVITTVTHRKLIFKLMVNMHFPAYADWANLDEIKICVTVLKVKIQVSFLFIQTSFSTCNYFADNFVYVSQEQKCEVSEAF